ncbi:DUF2141 domain-containing protein [Flammeovirgaceae bacterium KN852]|uniref:DUF2141 domain-containing protein n=2 Tax=Marinigracilibium pacificum TaxID=2729599 RepID=A0A848J331_9BACT|nr:DUF2141 domain-containing protein [Marinigracilibium pacificum]
MSFSNIVILAQTENLSIEIKEINSTSGKIHISIYSLQNKFLSLTDTFRFKAFNPSNSLERISFSVPPGKYAVATYHDLDDDGKMDKNLLGIPKEPYGFSNNFKLKLSAPKFEDCQIEVKENQTHRIEIFLQNY